MNKLSKYYHEHDFQVNFITSIILILVLFQIKFGLEILLPSNIAWLMKWDLAGYVIVLDIFRHEPWGFPLGQVNGYFYPIGANVGELLPLIVKLFDFILPQRFQYIGFFLISSHILVSYFSLKISRLFAIGGIVQLLVTMLIIINPVLLYRFIHPSLTAQWLVLASFWLYFSSSSSKDLNKVMFYQGSILVLSGLIFPYLAVMITGLVLALGFKLWLSDHRINFRKFSIYIAASFVALFLSWYLIGLITFSHSVDMGVPNAYGLYGWNLNSLYNAYDLDGNGYYKSNNLSSILPAFPHVTWHQYEGFSYLGAGMILLTLLAIALFFLRKRPAPNADGAVDKTNFYPLAVFTIMMALFAISNVVSFNDAVLFTVPIPAVVQKFGDIFRASSRFFWVAYYLILITVLYFLAKTIRSKAIVAVLLSAALILQVYDLKPMIFTDHFPYEEYHTPLQDDHWENLVKAFDQIMFYPPYQTSILSHDDYRYFTYFAAKNQKKINTGYLGRLDGVAIAENTRKLQAEIREAAVNDRSIYITLPYYAPELFRAYFDGNIKIVLLDGYLVFFSSKRAEDVAATLKQVMLANDQQPLTDLFKLQYATPVKFDQKAGSGIRTNMYEVTVTSKVAYIKGWGYIEKGEEIAADSVNIILRSGSRMWSVPARRFETPDVADFFHDQKYRYAGFSSALHVENLGKKPLQIGLSIYNHKTGSQAFQWTNSFVEPMENEYATAYLLKNLPAADENVRLTFDVISEKSKTIEILGWAFNAKHPQARSLMPNIVLFSGPRIYSFPAIRTIRDDVAEHFKDTTARNSGFRVKFRNDSLEKGTYRLGVLLTDSLHGNGYFQGTDRVIFAGYPEFSIPKQLSETPQDSDSVRAFIDKVDEQETYFQIEGWAFINNVSTDDSESWLVFKEKKTGKMIMLSTVPRDRQDIQEYFKPSYKINLAGFIVKVKKEALDPGTYELNILLVNKANYHKSFLNLDNIIEFN